MFRLIRERPRPFIYALLVHMALLGVLAFSLDWSPTVTPGAMVKKAPVQAVVIDAGKLESEIKRQQQLKDKTQHEAQEKLKRIEQKAKEAEQQLKREEKRLADLKRKEQQAAKKKVEAKKKAASEKKRKADLAAKKKAQVDKKAAAEKKRKAELAAKKKAEAKKKVEAKKKAEAARRKAAEQELQARLAAEQERMAAQRSSAMQRMVNEYVLYIKEKVQRNWIQPPSSGSELSCTVEVRLIPSGEVIEAKIVRSSGNPAFDRSVEAAVFKASPLPVPPDPDVMQKFRTIRFEFKPG